MTPLGRDQATLKIAIAALFILEHLRKKDPPPGQEPIKISSIDSLELSAGINKTPLDYPYFNSGCPWVSISQKAKEDQPDPVTLLGLGTATDPVKVEHKSPETPSSINGLVPSQPESPVEALAPLFDQDIVVENSDEAPVDVENYPVIIISDFSADGSKIEITDVTPSTENDTIEVELKNYASNSEPDKASIVEIKESETGCF